MGRLVMLTVTPKPALSERYIDRLRTRIRQGLALEAGHGGPAS